MRRENVKNGGIPDSFVEADRIYGWFGFRKNENNSKVFGQANDRIMESFIEGGGLKERQIWGRIL